MESKVKIADRWLGAGAPCYVVAEIGINHNGDVELARRLIRAAADAGCDAVKFQKRTPEVCVPEAQQGLLRETPWGLITYLDYAGGFENISDIRRCLPRSLTKPEPISHCSAADCSHTGTTVCGTRDSSARAPLR